MKSPNKLFELIKAMSASEKGYFKKYTLTHAKNHDQVYIQLFDILSSQKEYNEKKLVNALKKKSVSTKFGPYQNYLYKLILRSQRAYHSNVPFSTKIIELIMDSLLLRAKGLMEHSDKILKQAKEIAIQEEDLILLLKVEELQRENNIKRASIHAMEFNCQVIDPEMLSLADSTKENIQTYQLRNEIYLLYLKYGDHLKEKSAIRQAKKILNHPLLKDGKKYSTREVLYRALFTKKACYALLGDSLGAINIIRRHIRAIEKDPNFHTEHIKTRYGALLSDFLAEFWILKIEELEDAFKKVLELKLESLQQKMHILIYSYSNIMGGYINYEKMEKGLSLVPEFTKILAKYKAKLPVEGVLIFHINTSILYFMIRDYVNALKWMNKTLKYSTKELRMDTYSEVRIINILIHYELRNLMLVDSLLVSLERFLIKNKIMDTFSKMVIYHLKKIIFLNDKKERNEQLLVLKSKLDVLLKDQRDKKTYLLSWIDKKLEVSSKKQFLLHQ